MKFFALSATLSALCSSVGSSAASAEPPVQVMVIGTYHFANPGQDLHNPEVDDVLKPDRQAQLRALATAVRDFRPTKIMVERVVAAPDLRDPHFAQFAPQELSRNRDERVQIGYRIAHDLGLPVFGIDETAGKGEPDYFPFQAVLDSAKARNQEDRVEQLMAWGASLTKSVEQNQKTMTIAQMLIEYNRADGLQGSIGPYYHVLGIGGPDKQAGAELNAMWYLRNAKIFGKLMHVSKPGDRLLVVYGGGHGYWLRHFAQETPGYMNVDPVPFLRKAAGR